jgi:hypothetical protein
LTASMAIFIVKICSTSELFNKRGMESSLRRASDYFSTIA